VYKSVISDVITNIKEIFLDESIDIDVLNQLKNEWENKVNASGALDFDNHKSIPPPAVRPTQAKQQPIPHSFVQKSAPGPSHFVQLPPQRVSTNFLQPAGPSNFVQLPPQQLIHQQLGQQQLVQQPVQQQIPTLPPKPVIKSDYGIKQLDGGAPGMTDSSSEDEDDEEEDHISRFMGLQDERAEDAEDIQEDPLNSNDDQSDDEDLETLFQADNVIVCQFEKVTRARTKWKFILKDGIMHLNGRDYCFQKCTGEAEW